jgi:hypothetical protein
MCEHYTNAGDNADTGCDGRERTHHKKQPEQAAKHVDVMGYGPIFRVRRISAAAYHAYEMLDRL